MNAKPYIVAPANTACGWQDRGSQSKVSHNCRSGRDAVHILTKTLPVAEAGTALCAYHSPFDVVPGETATVKFRQCPFCGSPLVAGHSHFGRVVMGAGDLVPVETTDPGLAEWEEDLLSDADGPVSSNPHYSCGTHGGVCPTGEHPSHADKPVIGCTRCPWSPGAYLVVFRNGAGQVGQTTCAIIPGYSTVADIPKMITIKYGDACEILATMAVGMDTALLSSVLASLTGLRD